MIALHVYLGIAVCSLTQQEQAVVRGGWLPPGGGAGGVQDEGGQAVDIIQMLTKAHSQYDKVKTPAEKVKPSSQVGAIRRRERQANIAP